MSGYVAVQVVVTDDAQVRARSSGDSAAIDIGDVAIIFAGPAGKAGVVALLRRLADEIEGLS